MATLLFQNTTLTYAQVGKILKISRVSAFEAARRAVQLRLIDRDFNLMYKDCEEAVKKVLSCF